jgi:mandelate racemase
MPSEWRQCKAVTALTIKSINTRAILAPLTRPITTANATIEKAPLLLFDIQTQQGVVGHSYLFTYTPLVLKPLAGLVANIAEMQIGKSVSPITRFGDLEQTFRLLGRQGLIAMAMAGIDMALWDAFGKAQNLSVAELLGADTNAIPCYDSHGVFDRERDVATIEHSLAMGFEAIKFKIGSGTVADDVTTLRTIREITGPDIRLMVDYNQSLSSAEAIRRIHRLEHEFDLDWVEEPVPAEDFIGHKRIRQAVNTPIQTGENWWLPDDAARAIDAEICDHAMLDVMKIGGITGWTRAASLAAAASLPISSHIFIEASAHAMAATPNRNILEYLDVASAILVDPYEIQNGTLTPKGPGLGIAWNATALQKHSF